MNILLRIINAVTDQHQKDAHVHHESTSEGSEFLDDAIRIEQEPNTTQLNDDSNERLPADIQKRL